METSIGDNHKPVLARLQHLAEHLQAERARLETELRYVLAQGHQAQAQIAALLQQGYGIDTAAGGWTLDVERGVIVTPDRPNTE